MLDWGFHSVWTIQRHGSWFVLFHKVLLLTLSDHFTFMILRRHLFTNVYILFTVCLVILHVSELYNRTDLTLWLNILILVFSLISFYFHMLHRMRNATRAFLIRPCTQTAITLLLCFRCRRNSLRWLSSSSLTSTSFLARSSLVWAYWSRQTSE